VPLVSTPGFPGRALFCHDGPSEPHHHGG
jgi:hypothetical protein